MESLIALLGMMFFMFLVLAASVEMILEMLRGVLEQLGVTLMKSKVSLEEALKLAAEFAPNNNDLNTKIQAVKSAAGQIAKKTETKISELKKLESDLSAAGVDIKVISIAASVKSDLEESERNRIFVLRLLAAAVGSVLVWQTGFYVFTILCTAMAKYPQNEWIRIILNNKYIFNKLMSPSINIVIGGLVAAAGSSYWHDKLDRIRKLKTVVQDVKNLGK